MDDQRINDIDEIFEKLNFLRLKKTARDVLELPHDVLERFTGKYTSVIIYLLNILDTSTAVALLDRLTDTSIMYLMEEEIRLMLLSLFGHSSEDPQFLVNLSRLVEELDRSTGETFLDIKDYDAVRASMETLLSCRERNTGLKFLYLRDLNPDRLGNIISIILGNRPIIIPVLMIYAPDELRQFILIEITKKRPEILKVVPAGVYDLRFYTFLTARDIIAYLPDEVKDKLEYLEIVKRLEAGLERRIVEIEAEFADSAEKARDAVMNEIYEILASEDFEIQNLMLIDLVNKRHLSPGDAGLLRTIYQSKLKL
ncbi:MAG: hypothetical protein F9K24_07780 [Leptonema illini]|uniref:Uncharacterized protein n=1 Tax=Leptonema illini TaxID=183 RepID=A0A833M284_9LEPT|nr:MAG: hypothetical protein F9K24_07780 [Leptonema illini]PKL31531.1 MAG: hypothetical protein CVV45_15265 [Spirochaetae bacterium HGW-Spirochaetae-10]